MKRIFFILTLIGLLSLTSCGAQEDCRTRPSSYNYQQQDNQQLLATSENTVIEVK